LGKFLTDIDGLAMKEVVWEFTQIPVGSTFFQGSKPIGGVWATSDITVWNASIMPAGYGIGDHRLFVIDFSSSNIIGNMPPKVVRLASHWLNTKIPRAAAEYARILEGRIIQHWLIERVGNTHSECRSKRAITQHLNKLDKELGQYMHHAEKKCQKSNPAVSPSCPSRLSGFAGCRCTDHSSTTMLVESGTKEISINQHIGAISWMHSLSQSRKFITNLRFTLASVTISGNTANITGVNISTPV
jgi:hypothetical protein